MKAKSKYLRRSKRILMRWEKRGAYGDERSGVGPIASRLHIDKWWIELNREMFEMGKGRHPCIESSLECEYEREKEQKELQERFICPDRYLT